MVKIYVVRENGSRVFLENARNEAAAQSRIARYEREDRYAHEVEGYAPINVRYEYK